MTSNHSFSFFLSSYIFNVLKVLPKILFILSSLSANPFYSIFVKYIVSSSSSIIPVSQNTFDDFVMLKKKERKIFFYIINNNRRKDSDRTERKIWNDCLLRRNFSRLTTEKSIKAHLRCSHGAKL